MLFPIGIAGAGPGVIVLFADLWPGLLSIWVVEDGLGVSPRTFTGTLLTTIVQGALLNVVIFVIMSVLYALQRMFMTPPPQFRPHGFDVVMTSAAPVPVVSQQTRSG
jgi:hypothetical protein